MLESHKRVKSSKGKVTLLQNASIYTVEDASGFYYLQKLWFIPKEIVHFSLQVYVIFLKVWIYSESKTQTKDEIA